MGDDFAQSPKRRHILSSINPETRPDISYQETQTKDYHESTARESEELPQSPRQDNHAETSKPRRSRLRLKDHKSKRRRRSQSRDSDRDRHRQSPERTSHRHRHRHRRRRHHRSPTPPNPHEPPQLDPDAAFRESLFDAMADDEGASYWEGVYGQPVHVYPNERVGPSGELEQMTEEEYATYVRQKMWEKTHAGLLEERAKREEARQRKEKEERHSRKLHEEMERSLRRGEERRDRRHWQHRWEEYTGAWLAWDGTPISLAWPVESGRGEDVEETSVRAFFTRGLALNEIGEQTFLARLKDERVRWHPDKMQQRLGGQVDDEIMRRVTAIFQTIDRLWADLRPKA